MKSVLTLFIVLVAANSSEKCQKFFRNPYGEVSFCNLARQYISIHSLNNLNIRFTLFNMIFEIDNDGNLQCNKAYEEVLKIDLASANDSNINYIKKLIEKKLTTTTTTTISTITTNVFAVETPNVDIPNEEEPIVDIPNIEEPNVEESNVKRQNNEEPNDEEPNIEISNSENPVIKIETRKCYIKNIK
ncbi:hypothetical protein H8356DRAFT_1333382 [Neocallimastix lanati (nom. inval.)]|nr:hypothetical protein H8356DRAFT_1333382 [Neocallimastix sp. JGI-2020a]